jgi:hypothetical protein
MQLLELFDGERERERKNKLKISFSTTDRQKYLPFDIFSLNLDNSLYAGLKFIPHFETV